MKNVTSLFFCNAEPDWKRRYPPPPATSKRWPYVSAIVLSIRDLRLRLGPRRVRRVVCACTATAPLAIDAASNTPATCFTLDLKPNINDYSCGQAWLCSGRTRGYRRETGEVIPLLEHPTPLTAALTSNGELADGEKKRQRW